MKKITKSSVKHNNVVGDDFFERFWGKSWTLVKTVVDVVREPVLILDKDLRVLAGNTTFYETFKVQRKDTKGKPIHELGNGQWNIPALRKLLSEIVSSDKFFKGFQVAHDFASIGRRVMILNARQIHIQDELTAKPMPPIILLAIEDVTDMMVVAEDLASHAKKIEESLIKRIGRLEQEIHSLKKRA